MYYCESEYINIESEFHISVRPIIVQVSTELRAVLSRQKNYIQTWNIGSQYQGEISQSRKQSVSFVRRGLGFDPWWSGSLRLGG